MSSSPVYEAVVLGGGLNGLSTLYHLARMGLKRIALFEQFTLFHPYGSSHGESRITRSVYFEAIYVHLMRYAREEEWPRLENDSGKKLIRPCDGCIFGPEHGLFQKYAQTVLKINPQVHILDLKTAQRQFPQIQFNSGDGILQEVTAGIISADQTLRALAQISAQRGAVIYENTAVSKIEVAKNGITLSTAKGSFQTERLVITAGAWSAQLLPWMASRLNVIRQSVGYFKITSPIRSLIPKRLSEPGR